MLAAPRRMSYYRTMPGIGVPSPRTAGGCSCFREGAGLMAEKLVGKASEFKDGDRRIVFVGDTEIGVFRDRGEFHAYSNYCLHQGGPACEGLIIAKVEERIMPA